MQRRPPRVDSGESWMLKITSRVADELAFRPPGPAGKQVRRLKVSPTLRYLVLLWLAVFLLAASEHHGQVKFGGLPVPGATVTATQGDKKFTAISGEQGSYSFATLPDGIWTIQVEMLCFSPIKQEVTVAPDSPAAEWNLKLLPFEEIKSAAAPVAPAPPAPVSTPAPV